MSINDLAPDAFEQRRQILTVGLKEVRNRSESVDAAQCSLASDH
jgi:hypothetical protein